MMMPPFRKRPPRLGRCQIFIGFLDHYYVQIGCIPPRKVTWNPKMTRLKREIIFQISILRFHFFLWGVYVCIFVMCVNIHPDYAVGYRLDFPAFLQLV